MSLVKQLGLADISEPPAVSSLPAVGWWLVAGLIILALAGLAFYLIRRRRRLRRLQQTFKALDELMQKHQRNAATINLPTEINRLIKRQLIQAGHTQAQTLQGQEWINFVRQQIAPKYRQDIVSLLGKVYQPYDADAQMRQSLHQQATQWFKSLPC